MGNVQQRGKADRLTKFQREKLKHEFYTFFGKSFDLLPPKAMSEANYLR